LFQDLMLEQFIKKVEYDVANTPEVEKTNNQNELAAQELCKLSENDLLKIIQPEERKKGLLNTFQIGAYKRFERRANCASIADKKLALRK
jgi:hypothetical protein